MSIITLKKTVQMFRTLLIRPTFLLSKPCRSFHISTVSTKDWKIGNLSHVAIAVTDLDKSMELYKNAFGAKVSEKLDLPEHGVTTAFVDLGETKIELLHPLGKKSPIKNFLDKNKNGGIHHICIVVDDIEKAMQNLRSKKIRLLSEKAKIGAHGKPIIFAHPKDCDGVLVEFEQV